MNDEKKMSVDEMVDYIILQLNNFFKEEVLYEGEMCGIKVDLNKLKGSPRTLSQRLMAKGLSTETTYHFHLPTEFIVSYVIKKEDVYEYSTGRI